MSTAYAIMRVQKHTNAQSLRAATRHNLRTGRVPNADPDGPRPAVVAGSDNIETAVARRIQDAGIEKIRKNGVLAFELIATASPQWWHRDEEGWPCDLGQVEAFEHRALSWARQTFGEQNIVSAVRHLDESSPHLHVVVVPVDDTPRKNGPQTRLNARRWLGGKKKLAELQDGFSAAVADLGLERGQRGSTRTHQPSARWRAQMAEQLHHAHDELSELADTVNAEATRVSAQSEAIEKQQREMEREREWLERERRKMEAFSAGVKAWAEGDLTDAVIDDEGERRLRFRSRQARDFWGEKVRPAFGMVWNWVRRQTGWMRERVREERERIAERMKGERASERALVRDLVRDLRSVRETVGVVGGGVDERADRIERRAQQTVETPAREAPRWVRDAHKEANEVERRRQAKSAREYTTPTPPAPQPRRRWPWPRDRGAER